MPIVKKQKITDTKTKQKSTLLVEHPQMDSILKSVRVFDKDNVLYLDCRIRPEYRIDGKDRIRLSTGVQNTRRNMQRIERDKYAIALAHYLENTTVLDGANLTVEDIAMDALREDSSSRQYDTQADYERIYEVHIKPFFGKKVLQDIKVSDVKRWRNLMLEKNDLSKSRYGKFHRVLGFIFTHALENEMISFNPVTPVNKKSNLFTKSKKENSRKYYTKAEIEKILQHSEGWFKAMLTTYISSGIRSGEGLALAWEDIDFEQSTITIQRSKRKGVLKNTTKTGKSRVIRMSKPLKEELLEYKKVCTSDVWLFPNERTGEPFYETNSINKRYFQPLLKKLDIEYISFYALRHSFASLAVQQGVSMPAIQNQLGHSKLSTTQDYYINFDLLAEKDSVDLLDNLYT